MLTVVMLSVTNKHFMLSVFMPNGIMLSVVMLNVVAPFICSITLHNFQTLL
jgi:hypothetical protein